MNFHTKIKKPCSNKSAGLLFEILILCRYCIFFFNAGINQDPSAMLAYNYFLMLADFKLALRRNFIKASSAGITLNCNNSKSVTGIAANTLVCRQQALVSNGACFLRNFFQMRFFFFSFCNDAVELGSFRLQRFLFIFKISLGYLKIGFLIFDLDGKLFNAFFGKLNFQVLKLNLFGE